MKQSDLHALIQRLADGLDLPPWQPKAAEAQMPNGSAGQNGVHVQASSSADEELSS